YPQEVVIDPREVQNASPGKPSYSFDTLQELRKDDPRIAFVIGADQLQELPRWHRFPEILGLCHWIILKRGTILKRGLNRQPEEDLADLQGSNRIRPVSTVL